MTIDRARRGSPAAMAVLGLVALGLSGWIVLNSAFFEVRDVRVEGTLNVSADEVRLLADIPPDANLIMLPLEEVSARVEADPWVLDAQVLRDLPTTAVIRVIERRPGGWMEDPIGMAIVAGDGTVLERVTEAPPRLPRVGASADALTVGERVEIPGESVRVAASMGQPLRAKIASLELQGVNVTLHLREGGTVLYGEPVDLPAKNRAVAEMLRWAEGEGIEVGTIDVRVASAPSLQPVRADGDPSPRPSP